ncbi:hypothetical protein SRHO_G00154770 [Serrasalmus rhombeus]
MGCQGSPLYNYATNTKDRKDTPLVGPNNEGEVMVNGKACRALIDSGSQVTTITNTFWKTHPQLGLQSLKPSDVPIEGAAGQQVPHYGVLDINLHFLNTTFNNVPAFVVPETEYRTSVPLLIGTNVICASKEHFQASSDKQFLSKVKQTNPEWYSALMDVGNTKAKGTDGKIGTVRFAGHHTKIIPPGSERNLKCKTCRGPKGTAYTALVERLPFQKPPDGLVVARVLADVKKGFVPVRVMNVSARPVSVKPNTPIAAAFLVKSVTEITGEVGSGSDSKLGDDGCVSECQNNKAQKEMVRLTNSGVDGDIFSMLDLSGCTLDNADQYSRLKELIIRNADVFSQHSLDYGYTKTVQHEIPLIDTKPFRMPYRKIPPTQYQQVRKAIEEMENAGVIRPSKSPYSSPIVVVTKRDGSLRICIDYRKLNSCSTRDAFPLPRIEDALEALGQAKYFSTVDLTCGYWQVEVAEHDKHKTAFSTPMGLYEANRMPFGLQNGPSTFQRLMMCCFGDLNFLKPQKCQLLRKEVQYLGHVVSADGISTDPEKISKVKYWPKPTNRKELLKFLGFSGYYRRFIEGYASIAAPLYHLTSGDPRQKKRGNSPGQAVVPFKWTMDCQTAFETLTEKLITAPVLGYPDYNLPFVLQIDASGEGLGAVLAQVQGGAERVIAYGSRGLTPAESHYPAHKLEFLTLKWAVTDKFYDHLYGNQFTVLTDNNPLKYVMSTAKLDATGQRWVSQLAMFNFDIQYRP